MTQAREFKRALALLARAKKHLDPPQPLSLSAWADEFRKLSRESSAEPGQWYTEPYQREPMDAVTQPGTREIVVMAASQMLKTEILLNTIGYYTAHEPSPMLYVAPNERPMAESFSLERLAPMIRDTPVLAPLFAPHRSRDSGNKMLHKLFPGGFIALAGANSPAGLAMRPIRILLMDEIDRYPKSAGKEGDPIEIARARTKTYYNRKIVLVSSPTTERGQIYRAWANSDQRVFEVPCPHCGAFQELQWENLKFAFEDLTVDPVYECASCHKDIEEKHKYAMVHDGRYRATAESDVPGFRLSELVSLRRSWSEIVYQFSKAYAEAKKGDASKLQAFVNTVLARPFEDKGDAPDHLHIYARREYYERGVVPAGGLFMTAAVDVQNDRLEVELRAWGRDGVSWSVDHLVYYGDTGAEDIYKNLDRLLSNTWPVYGSARRMAIKALGIDTGGSHTQVVYAWCRQQNASIVKPLKGASPRQLTIIAPPSPVDVDYGGRKIKNGLSIWNVNVSPIKSELYSRLRFTKAEDGTPPPGYIHFPDYPENYFSQLVSEAQIERHDGKIVWEKSGPNEALDLAVYNRALTMILGMDYLTDQDWDELEKNIVDQSTPDKVLSQAEPPQRRAVRLDLD